MKVVVLEGLLSPNDLSSPTLRIPHPLHPGSHEIGDPFPRAIGFPRGSFTPPSPLLVQIHDWWTS